MGQSNLTPKAHSSRVAEGNMATAFGGGRTGMVAAAAHTAIWVRAVEVKAGMMTRGFGPALGSSPSVLQSRHGLGRRAPSLCGIPQTVHCDFLAFKIISKWKVPERPTGQVTTAAFLLESCSNTMTFPHLCNMQIILPPTLL